MKEFKMSVTLKHQGGPSDDTPATTELFVFFADGVLSDGGATAQNALDELVCRMSSGSGISIQGANPSANETIG